MNKIKTGDEVIVLCGKDKSKRGFVVSRAGDSHVVVEGVNVAKKHTKPNPMKNVVGGIVDKTMPIHQSNVAIFNAATGKADRVGVKTLADGTRVRTYKSSGEEIKSVVPAKKSA
jgi:large subunit ribosomal protein L24